MMIQRGALPGFSSVLLFVLCLTAFSCGDRKPSERPQRQDITETVFAPGTLEPAYIYNLTAQTEGIVTELLFEEGDSVRAGQLLAIIDNKPNAISSASARRLLGIAELQASAAGPLLKQAEQNIALLKEKMQQDSLQWQRYEKLYASASAPKIELERARLAYESSRTAWQNAVLGYNLQRQQAEQQAISQRAQKEISQVSESFNEVRAVLAGRVYRRVKERGDFVRRGELIAVVGDGRRMRAKLSVDESNISKIKKNQRAEIRLNTDRERVYEAAISEIAPSFDEHSQSFICKADFVQQPDFKVHGTQLQANIVTGEKKNALVIPRRFYNYNNQVHVKGKGPVAIKPGFISSDWVEVLEGLDENDALTTP